MKNRITVKGIMFKDDKILLLKHKHPKSGFVWWAFPGGAVEDDETIFQCLEREVWEETNLKVKVGKLRFIRQFIDKDVQANNIELFIEASIIDGKEHMNNLKGKSDEQFIQELGYFSKEEIRKVNVLPEILKEKVFEKKGEIELIGVDENVV